jgi:hypothetical protein
LAACVDPKNLKEVEEKTIKDNQREENKKRTEHRVSIAPLLTSAL